MNKVVLFLLAALLLFAPQARGQCVPGNTGDSKCQADIARIRSFMVADGYDYRTTNSDTVWKIPFTGKNMPNIKVIVAVGDNSDSGLVVFVTVVEKYRMPVDADFRGTLLKLNHEYDAVKVGFDKDGDLSVRMDAPLRILDAEHFRFAVHQVEVVSDEIYGKIASSLAPATGPDANNN